MLLPLHRWPISWPRQPPSHCSLLCDLCPSVEISSAQKLAWKFASPSANVMIMKFPQGTTHRAARSGEADGRQIGNSALCGPTLAPFARSRERASPRGVVVSSFIPHLSLVQHPVARRPIPLDLRLAQIPNATPTSTVVVNLHRRPSLQVRHLSEVQHTRLAPSELCNIYIRGAFCCCVATYSLEATPVAQCGGRHRRNRIPNWKFANLMTNSQERT